MKLSTAQRSAMLALWLADGQWKTQKQIKTRLFTLDSLVERGLVDALTSHYGNSGWKLTESGRDWCKTNFTHVLTAMINEAEK
jgi:hypothetical protein